MIQCLIATHLLWLWLYLLCTCTVFIVIKRLSPSDGSSRPPWPPRCSTSTRPASMAASSILRPRALRTVTMSGAVVISSFAPKGAPM